MPRDHQENVDPRCDEVDGEPEPVGGTAHHSCSLRRWADLGRQPIFQLVRMCVAVPPYKSVQVPLLGLELERSVPLPAIRIRRQTDRKSSALSLNPYSLPSVSGGITHVPECVRSGPE